MPKTITGIIVRALDTIPFLKGYRTLIFLGGVFGLALVDKLGVGPGNLYETYSPWIWPAAVATGLAHPRPDQKRLLP